MKKMLALLLALVLVLGLAACTSETDTTNQNSNTNSTQQGNTTQPDDTTPENSDDDKILIGWSCGYIETNHWTLEIAGSQYAANQAGVEMYAKFADGNDVQQVEDIETMAEMGMDYLITCPVNAEGLAPTVEALHEKGIYVGTSDSTINSDLITCHVTSDNYMIGQEAAKFLGEALNGEGNLAICSWDVTSACALRKQGLVDTLAEEYPNIKIVDYKDTYGDRTQSLDYVETVLQAHPEINAIYGVTAEQALGALAGTKSMGREDVIVVATDTDTEVMDAIKAGSNLVASVGQDPFEMGRIAMENALKILNGETVEEKETLILVVLITAENVDEIVQRNEDYLASVQ